MALKGLFLLDKSAWEQRSKDERARDRVRQLREQGRLAVCTPMLAEVLYSARNIDEMEMFVDEFTKLPHLPMNRDAEQQVTNSMLALARRGHHRRPIPDLLVAAIAHVHGATMLHYDRDFDLIAEVTGQSTEWIVDRGTGHGNTRS